MKRIHLSLLLLALINGSIVALETLRWTGKGDGKSFWATANWAVGTGTTPPTAGQLSPASPIDFNLLIENASHTIGNNGTLNNAIIGTNSTSIRLVDSALGFDVYTRKGLRAYAPLTIDLEDSYLGVDQLMNMTVNVKGSSTLSIYESPLFSAINNSTVNLLDEDAWIGFRNIRASQLTDAALSFVKVKGAPLVIGNNVELKSYYSGTLVRAKRSTALDPLTIYAQDNLSGAHAVLAVRQIYAFESIPLGNNRCRSFVLRKGHMATLAQNSDGTGMSKVFIAAEKDLTIHTLPTGLKDDVSFIRVLPWIYTNKRGVGWGARMNPTYDADLEAIHPGWYYNWGANRNSTDKTEYVLMTWGLSASTALRAQEYIAKEGVTHLLSFNEPDNVAQSNIPPGVAVESYKNVLGTGLRIGSPAPCEEGLLNGWVPTFMEGCKNANYRVDFMTAHWYDWGNWLSTNNPNPDIDQAVNRFKSYLQKVYDKYKLPIWITEFNINDNRGLAPNMAFLEKVIPILESLDYVERYAFFNPGSMLADFMKDGNVTEIGAVYRDFAGTGAIESPTRVSGGSFYDSYNPIDPGQTLLKNGDFEDALLSSGWTAYQYNTAKQSTIPNPQSGTSYLRFSGEKGDKYGTVTQVLELKPSTRYKLTFYTYFGGADAANSYNSLYLGVRGFTTKDAAEANATGTFVNLIEGDAASYSVAKGAGPLASDTEWSLHTVYLTTTASNYFGRLNIGKNFGVWNVDNVVLEELPASNIVQPGGDWFRVETAESTIRIQSPTDATVMIYGLNGALLQVVSIVSGESSISTRCLTKGSYVVRVAGGGAVETVKFVK